MSGSKRTTSATGRSGATHVALLRGVNVGGRNMIAMGVLAEMFEWAGAREVATYIQTGNVLFAPAGVESPEAIANRVRGEIKKRLGFEPVIVVRRGKDMWRVATRHPFESEAGDGKGLYVGFFDARLTTAAVRALDPERSPGDRFEVRGLEIYLLYMASKTKLTNAYIDSTLGLTSTMRNWNTVRRLAEMLRG